MVSLTITFYHEGVFVGPPLEYLEGNKDTMKDLDFGNFTYGKFFECIKAATLFPPVGIFYCLPGSDLSDGIRELKNEQQLAYLVATALGNGGHIDVIRSGLVPSYLLVVTSNLIEGLCDYISDGHRVLRRMKLNAGCGVNLETHNVHVGCGILTGIPVSWCSAYALLMKDPAEGVSDFYSKTAWQNCYISFIKPVSGQSMWVKTGLPPPMPPKKRVMPGRPKRKRQKHPSEVNDSSSQRVSRFGRTMTCSNCYQRGHNKKRCKNETVDPNTKGKGKA
ncbi:hypothetical protein Tco_0868058 [Tanacetum coccineum]